MADWTLSADEIVAFPLDALALQVLQHAHDSDEWNSYNWMLARGRELQGRNDALRALEEAWAWLRARALVAHDPQKSHDASIFVTRPGVLALQEGLARTRAEERLNLDLHRRIDATVASQFLLGEYELATIAAFREVEIRVRELGRFDADLVGTDLMHKAFRLPDGPLTDLDATRAEQEGMMKLFAGAYATFRNPPSHRSTDLGDVTMASEVVLLADLLLRILDQVGERAPRQRREAARELDRQATAKRAKRRRSDEALGRA